MKTSIGWNDLAFLLLVPMLALTLVGCDSGEEEPPDGSTQETSADSNEAASDKPDRASLDLVETTAVLVLPAPSEIVAAVESESGLDTASALGEPLPSYEALSSSRKAIALGRVIADLLIAVPGAPTERVVAYLDNIEVGLRSLGIAEDQISQLESLRSEIAAGAIGRDALVDRFDRIRLEVLERGKAQLGDQMMALVAAGGWARAVNIVSNHLQETGQTPDRADSLKVRRVVTTLIDRIGSGEDVRPVVESLEKILPLTAARPSAPSSEELAILVHETGEILSLTRSG